MNFTRKKLPSEAAPYLRVCPIHAVAPYAPMLAPVYVYMKLNEKFVSIKAPLDFFTPEELVRLQPFESLFFPEFVDSVRPFQEAGRRTRALMQVEDATPYEMSNAVLMTVGPLWSAMSGDSKDASIEPFFVAAFANEFCDPLPGENLKHARDADIALYETAIFRSSWAVFLALHLGYCEPRYLSALRRRVFDETLTGKYSKGSGTEIDELVHLVSELIVTAGAKVILASDLERFTDRVPRKIASRMSRVMNELLREGAPIPSVYGPSGFRAEEGSDA